MVAVIPVDLAPDVKLTPYYEIFFTHWP